MTGENSEVVSLPSKSHFFPAMVAISFGQFTAGILWMKKGYIDLHWIQIDCDTCEPQAHWIGLREKLQETTIIHRKIHGFPVDFPLNQSIDRVHPPGMRRIIRCPSRGSCTLAAKYPVKAPKVAVLGPIVASFCACLVL